MTARQIRRRLAGIEETLCPRRDGTFTLAELLREIWRCDRESYMESLARGDFAFRLLLPEFENEAADQLNETTKRGDPASRPVSPGLLHQERECPKRGSWT
jgi:hypothetical protein